jgi:predicted component of type VI protein secretion system
MPIRLIPATAGEPIRLDKPVLLIGRNPDCDVVLTESRKVSRNHCLIACVDDKLFVRDLGSTNGVWINGHRVEREGRIRAGDELSIADLKYAVRQVDRNGTAKTDRAGEPAPRHPVSSESEAGGRRVRKVGVSPQLDGDQPVAIPDEDDSFVVEASAPRLPRVRRDEIEARRDEARHQRPRENEPAPPVAESGVLGLVEPLNLDMPLDLSAALDDESNEVGVPRKRAVADQLSSDDGATPQGDLSDAWLPAGDDDDPLIIPLDD